LAIRERKVVRISDIAEHIPDVSDKTLNRDLAILEKETLIRKIGRGKSASYLFLEHFNEIHSKSNFTTPKG